MESSAIVTLVDAPEESGEISHTLEIKHGERIGKGACSEVRKASVGGVTYALKVGSLANSTVMQQLLQELVILSSLRCDQIVTLHTAYHDETDLVLVLEYMDHGGLDRCLHPRRGQVPEDCLRVIAHDVVRGLAYLHEVGVLHRDMKPGNLLVNQRGEVKIADLGLAKVLSPEIPAATSSVGTVVYRSPEQLGAGAYGPPSDIWSFGITLLHLACGRSIVTGDIWDVQRATNQGPGLLDSLPTQCSESLRSFLRVCCQVAPGARWTAQTLCLHPFVVLGETELVAGRTQLIGFLAGTHKSIVINRG